MTGTAEARVLLESGEDVEAARGGPRKKAEAVGVEMADGGREEEEPVALSWRLDRSVVRKAVAWWLAGARTTGGGWA